jgi:hypothetical protein
MKSRTIPMTPTTKILAMSALLVGAALSMAHAQSTPSGDDGIRPGHVPGVGTSYPLSPKASNIGPADTQSNIAPTPPEPGIGPDAGVQQYLTAANVALAAGQTGTADAALEEAETRILTPSVPQTAGDAPSSDPVVARIEQARSDIGSKNKSAATEAINQILASNAPELAE